MNNKNNDEKTSNKNNNNVNNYHTNSCICCYDSWGITKPNFTGRTSTKFIGVQGAHHVITINAIGTFTAEFSLHDKKEKFEKAIKAC
jgi:hypothetical protein